MKSQHFMSNVRWILTGNALPKPRAYFVERTARRQADAISRASGTHVHIEEQVLVCGTWLSVPEACAAA